MNTTLSSGSLLETKADQEVRGCLEDSRSFAMIAGAGSGKTTSLITALELIREQFGARMRRSEQRVLCLTYTKRAVAVISSRLNWDDLFLVGTLHSFLWNEIKHYPTEIRSALRDSVIPAAIEKKRLDDKGKSRKATAAREKIRQLEDEILAIVNVPSFSYANSVFSDYRAGELGHDDLISVAAHMMSTSRPLRLIIGQKYPYIFVDEAQDTHDAVVSALNVLCNSPGLPLVGYFGDPMQQIYDKSAGAFVGPPGSQRITKEENFRCSCSVVDLLNAFREDVQQFPAGKNLEVPGSVRIRLIEAEKPEDPSRRYSTAQLKRASAKLDKALDEWGWTDQADVKHLYLVRQMIARRIGFGDIHALFTGPYASISAQDEYESGKHFLLSPLILVLHPLVSAFKQDRSRVIIDLLRQNSPEFNPKGKNAKVSLGVMREKASRLVRELAELWGSATSEEVLRFSRDNGLINSSRRLDEHLGRAPRNEDYDEELHSKNKSDWLADQFFSMKLDEVGRFCELITENTVFSTQHGVKGEQYERVLVVFDDVGSAWTNYSFSKTLAPSTAGVPTERQLRLSRHLAYVCFSRAEVDLRIAMFIENARAAKGELIDRRLFSESQIEVQD